ncbi:hypothetical protein [Pseudomaricurvus sp. HS19]|uniref:hypothetical protein n=1 Tax=Pseudomaricurvus sp. HS19 TaxID=2692626 RepID=UPI00136BB8BE|nr:hypothetical protein [Pseudomaricurvus sp. HS19]MYM63318.1 hypothetical protein [Pseudomaricurvus sp. HS19]
MATKKQPTDKPSRILKKGTCPQLSRTTDAELTYNIGYSDSSHALFIRITANSGGGFFSNEWIALEAITNVIEVLPRKEPFPALVLKPLYQSRGANNHGFLAAALRQEGILVAVDTKPYLNLFGGMKAFSDGIGKLIQNNTALEDEVALHEAEVEAKREALIAQVKAAAGKAPRKK